MQLNSQEIIHLNKGWHFSETAKDNWNPFPFPGTIHHALEFNKLIPDPFYSDNEQYLQEIGNKPYIIKTSFVVDSIRLQHTPYISIHFDCIDTYAKIILNGRTIQLCRNAFYPYTIQIAPYLQSGENTIEIHFEPQDQIAQQLYESLETPLPGGKRVTLRKPQYHYGWDWGPTYITSGIHGDCYLRFQTTQVLPSSYIITDSITDNTAYIKHVLECNFEVATELDVTITIGKQTIKQSYEFNSGSHSIINHYQIDNILPWWPHDMGEPTLYPVQITYSKQAEIIHTEQFEYGFREIKLISEFDTWGQSFYFTINGKPLFIKGSNYIPPEIIYTNPQKTDQLLQDAKTSNFNMLRIWGGGNYESDAFYKQCDKLGILIWQDFMFACAMYPYDKHFAAEVNQEASYQVKRLSKYACIALWCGNNENNEAWHRWGWQTGLDDKTKRSIWKNYQSLFNGLLPNIVAQYSNHTSYWESSPKYGRGDKRFKSEGDAHDWGIWHDEMPFEAFEKRVPRFMSEAGFQSIPELKTLHSFCPEDEELKLESNALLAHQKHPRGNQLIKKYLSWDYGKAKQFEDLIYLSQINQAEGITKAILAHRRAKPYCMGTLYWQYNDCWPVISWSSIDYFGNWKALQYYVKEAYKPIILSAESSKDEILIFGINDTHTQHEGICKSFILHVNGDTLFSKSENIILDADSSKILSKIELKKLPKTYDKQTCFLVYQLYSTEGELLESRNHYFVKPKAFRSLETDIDMRIKSMDAEKQTIVLTSKSLARNVYLSCDIPGRFDKNFIDLLPKTATEIHFYPETLNGEKPNYKLRYLHPAIH